MATMLRQGQPCTAPLNNSKGRPTSALTSAEAQPFDLAGRVADQVRGDDVAALLARTGEPFLLVTARHWRARCSSKRGEPRVRAMVRRTASGFADDGRPLPVHLRVLARLELDVIDLLNRGSRRSRQSATRCTGGTRAAGEPLRRLTPQPAARRRTTFQDAGGGVALTCLHAAAGRGDRWGCRSRRRIVGPEVAPTDEVQTINLLDSCSQIRECCSPTNARSAVAHARLRSGARSGPGLLGLACRGRPGSQLSNVKGPLRADAAGGLHPHRSASWRRRDPTARIRNIASHA